MKGLVLELRDGLAAVLREDGQVVTTAMACQVGETVELPAEVIPFAAGEPVSTRRRRWASGLVAAVLALAAAGGGYTYNTAVACSYVSVDAASWPSTAGGRSLTCGPWTRTLPGWPRRSPAICGG